MSHAVLSVTIAGSLLYVRLDSQRQCHTVLFNSIAEQNLNSIFVGSASTRCRDRYRCTSSSVTYNIAVVITEVNCFAVPFGVDFKFSVSQRKRLICSRGTCWKSVRIQYICGTIATETI